MYPSAQEIIAHNIVNVIYPIKYIVVFFDVQLLGYNLIYRAKQYNPMNEIGLHPESRNVVAFEHHAKIV